MSAVDGGDHRAIWQVPQRRSPGCALGSICDLSRVAWPLYLGLESYPSHSSVTQVISRNSLGYMRIAATIFTQSIRIDLLG